MLNPVDKEKSTQQPSLHGHRTPSSPKQQPPGNKDETEESWRTVPVQNHSNVANPSAPHHPTGALLTVAAGTGTVAGTPGERGWCWWNCPRWQQQRKVWRKPPPWPRNGAAPGSSSQKDVAEFSKAWRWTNLPGCLALPWLREPAPGNFLGSLAKKSCSLCSKATGRTEELHVPVPSLLKGPQIISMSLG